VQEFRSTMQPASRESHIPHFPQDTKPKRRAWQFLVVPTTTLTITLGEKSFSQLTLSYQLRDKLFLTATSWPTSSICPWHQQIPKL